MTMQEYEQLTTFEKIKLLRKCNGKHNTIDSLFTCESCNIVLLKMEATQ